MSLPHIYWLAFDRTSINTTNGYSNVTKECTAMCFPGFILGAKINCCNFDKCNRNTILTKKDRIQCLSCKNCPGSYGKISLPVIIECNGYCTEIVYNNSGHIVISKYCLETCLQTRTDTTTKTCCDRNNCNKSNKLISNLLKKLVFIYIFSFI
ncbi:unnamed protein product [Brachionus calyciflorus]|uniref:Uncharacterized protein n=1 Tax=Brachionus calyciflorus TaxID=104777 RepID=A0A814ERQ2_9BILA|nr:unnamed protein product [Brachionus calyciflorus]